MRFVLLIAGLLCLGTDAFALLGDTRERADERYGVAHSESPAIRDQPLVEGAHHAIYHFEGFEIYCAFLKATDGRSYSVRERYQRLSPPPSVKPRPSPYLQDFEVDALLATQGGASAWKKSDRNSLSALAPDWLRKRLRLHQYGSFWTRRDGALAHGGYGNISITFSHPQSLTHESQLENGNPESGREEVNQFVAAIMQAHQAPASHSMIQEAPPAPLTHSDGRERRSSAAPVPPGAHTPAVRSTPVTQKSSADPKADLVTFGVVVVFGIGILRLVLGLLKNASRNAKMRTPLRQSPRSSPPPLRGQLGGSATPLRPPTLAEIEWDEFELLIGEIYRRQGYEVEISSGDGADGGIDLVLRKGEETVLVQCKHWQTSKVGAKEIREFYGVLVSEGASRGIFVTTHEYSRDALEFAAGKPIELINRAGLAELIVMGQRSDMADLLDIPEWAPFFKSSAQVLDPMCPFCKSTMLLRNSKGGVFWGCGRYPKCRGTRKTKRHLVG